MRYEAAIHLRLHILPSHPDRSGNYNRANAQKEVAMSRISIRQWAIKRLGGYATQQRITYNSIAENPEAITETASLDNGGTVTVSAIGLTSNHIKTILAMLRTPLRIELSRLARNGYSFREAVRQRLLVEQSAYVIEVVVTIDQATLTRSDGATREDLEHHLEHVMEQVYGVLIMHGCMRRSPLGDIMSTLMGGDGIATGDGTLRARFMPADALFGDLPGSRYDAGPDDDSGRPTPYL